MKGFAPFARVRHIPPGSSDPEIVPRAAILHVAASLATTLFFWFRDRSGGVESHFFITLTGRIEQYRSIYRQADANLDANDFAVAIETAGLGGGRWNPLQRRAIARLLLWLNTETEGRIPLRRIERWNGSGVGYHTMWGSPSHWTPVAKSCPGPERIKQFRTWLLPWLGVARVELGWAATYNLGAGKAHRKVTDLVKLAEGGASVIGLQEASDRGDVLEEFLDAHPTWRVWSPKLGGAPAVPILFDGRVWAAQRFRSVLAVAASVVGAGPGPRRAKAKRINLVRLKARRGGTVRRFANTHFIADPDGNPERLAHYVKHVARLVRVIGRGRLRRRTVVLGDFNAERGFGPLEPIRARLGGWTRTPTRDRRALDHILGLPGDRRTVLLSSDHRAVLAAIVEVD